MAEPSFDDHWKALKITDIRCDEHWWALKSIDMFWWALISIEEYWYVLENMRMHYTSLYEGLVNKLTSEIITMQCENPHWQVIEICAASVARDGDGFINEYL